MLRVHSLIYTALLYMVEHSKREKNGGQLPPSFITLLELQSRR